MHIICLCDIDQTSLPASCVFARCWEKICSISMALPRHLQKLCSWDRSN